MDFSRDIAHITCHSHVFLYDFDSIDDTKYGTNDLYGHDRLRLWVKLGLNLNPETPFPPNYEAISDNLDEVFITGTLYSQELSTAGSSDSDQACSTVSAR